MTEAMPFLQKAILLSYDPRPSGGCFFGISGLYGARVVSGSPFWEKTHAAGAGE